MAYKFITEDMGRGLSERINYNQSSITTIQSSIATIQTNIQEVENNVEDITESIGVLSDLNTTNKSSLVSAINEAAQSGGSGESKEYEAGSGIKIENGIISLDAKFEYDEETGNFYLVMGEDSSLAPGTYDAEGNMLKSWDELIADGDFIVGPGNVAKSDSGIYDVDPYYVESVLTSDYLGEGYDGEQDNFIGVSKIVVSDTVTAIGNYAFMGSRDLKEVILPDSIKYIGIRAFLDCPVLSSMSIPNSVIDMGDFAFAFTSSLDNISLPGGVQTVRRGLFWHSGVKSVVVSEGTTSIQEQAFGYCESLQEIFISNSVTSIDAQIGMGSFTGCSNPITIHYSGTATGAPWGATNATIVP